MPPMRQFGAKGHNPRRDRAVPRAFGALPARRGAWHAPNIGKNPKIALTRCKFISTGKIGTNSVPIRAAGKHAVGASAGRTCAVPGALEWLFDPEETSPP
ncbi:hypothetical protein BGC_09770 [Burkholderia sp. 3C]